MNEEKLKKLKEKIKEEEKQYDFNDYIENWLDEERLMTITDINQLRDYLEEINEDGEITYVEVIYYSFAIKYLAENDPSLKESLEIASEYGHNINQLNSELLAGLLKTKYNEEDYYDFIVDIINFAKEEIFIDEEANQFIKIDNKRR